jgi:hypothetical protein
MNPSQQEAYDKAQIMLAYARGEAVEYRVPHGEWIDIMDANFTDPYDCYRIKPKPVKGWFRIYPNGEIYGPYRDKGMASIENGARAVLMHEVVDE